MSFAGLAGFLAITHFGTNRIYTKFLFTNFVAKTKLALQSTTSEGSPNHLAIMPSVPEVPMPSEQRESLDIEKVLEDLYRKKRWLDTVIEGLEQAIQSPEIRLIDAVQAAFVDESAPRVDLAAHEGSLLRTLASQVPRQSRGGKETAIDNAEEAA